MLNSQEVERLEGAVVEGLIVGWTFVEKCSNERTDK